MTHNRTRTRTIAAAALAAACVLARPAAAQEHSHSHAPLPASAQGYAWTPADAHFMSAMIHHHAQAIEMSRMAPTHGAGETVKTLAARIINAQQGEIATMQQWLRERGQPVPEATAGPMTMNMNGMQHEMLMPGMLTPEHMARLDQARGPEFERLFLTFMIQHHTGATEMVRELFGTQGAGQDESVFKFASDVNVDQSTEIARMQRMLAALLFESPVTP
ncbi:MAG TPA: DUF305 domain-containing protein [Longimicrobium sp.]|nr:DUF305 domain-containing protein [Longimicrobium sp.]